VEQQRKFHNNNFLTYASTVNKPAVCIMAHKKHDMQSSTELIRCQASV
jgi:hypothetical protein